MRGLVGLWLATLLPVAHAATFIWDGGHPAQNFWSLNQNWNPNAAPVNDGTADLVFSGTIRLGTNANGTWNINSMTFDAFAGAFTVTGDALTLQGSAITHAVANDSAHAITISNAISLGASQSWNANTAELSFSGTIALGANTLSIAGSSNTTASGAISGSGGLTKTGTGTLTLSGLNTYSGGTTVSGGTLLGTTTSLQGNITNDATVVFNQATSGTYGGVISGSGSLTKENSGTLTLSSAQTYTGATTITGGTLALGTSNTLSSSTAVSVSSEATLQLSGGSQTVASIAGAGSVDLGSHTLTTGGSNASTTLSGAITGTGALVKTGTGTLTLTGTNSYSGGTTISAGTLQGSTTSLQGNFANSGTLVFDQSTNGTFAGAISGSGSLTKQNTGTLTLTGVNTYSGTTTISAGTLSLGAANALSSTNSVVVDTGATLRLAAAAQTLGSVSGAGNIDLGSFALTTGGSNTSNTLSGSISGTGSLTKTGSGTLRLSGTNSYSGGTTVSAGTLQGTTSSLQGNITNNAAVVFDQTTTGTYAGSMSGSGSLTKENTGTVILTGVNSYLGGTTVSGGTLQGDTSSLQGSITNNAAVIFDQGTDGIYSSNMSGSGSLTKQGAGTLTLSGTNSYLGGTTVTAGALQGNTSSLPGNITNDAVVIFNQEVNGTYSGIVSGSGSLSKLSAGTLTLSGANTYSGGTTVTGGILQGNTTSLQGNITNNAAVVFDQATAGTYAGNMSGIGSMTKDGAGMLTLSGTNSYSGGTTVNAGTLQGTTSSVQGNIVNNDALVVFDQATSGTYSGVMSGTGALTKQGTGTVTLTGANTYSGSTTVSAGTLAIGADNALSSNSNVTLSTSSTLALGGFSAQVGTLSFGTSIIDFGSGAGANTFLFSGGGTRIDNGTLTINNFNASTDIFAFAASTSVDSILAGIYFYGLGAAQIGDTVTISSVDWTKITPNTTAFRVWEGGSGNTWNNGNNWDANNALNGGTNLRVEFGGGSETPSVVDANFTLNTLRFTSAANSYLISATGGSALTFDGAVPSIIQLSSSAQTISAPLAFNSATIVETSGAGDLTLSGVISGANGGINKVGTDTLILAGANTYDGTTTVNDGTLIIQNSTALGSTTGGTTVKSGSTLQLEQNVSVGAEALTLDGTMVNASGANSFAGPISGTGVVNVTGGSLSLGGSTSNSYTGDTTVSGGSTLTLAKTGGATAIAGNLSIAAGTVQLSGSEQIANTSAVSLTSASSVFNVGTHTETIGSLTGVASSSVQIGTGGSLTTGADASSTTFAGVISGAGSLTKDGTGSFTLSGANTYSGATTVSAGTLIAEHSSALGTTDAGTTVDSGATLQLQGGITIGSEALTLNGALRSASGTNTYNGAISGSGTLTIDSGSLTLGGSAANTFTGLTTVSTGTLDLNKSADTNAIAGNLTIGDGTGSATVRLLASNQIGDTSAVTLNATGTPVLNLNGFSETIGSLASTNSAAAVQLGAGSLTTGGDNSSTTFAGVISGTGALTKQGAGTMTLTGWNTYSGGTTVSAGTIQGTTTSLQGAITNNAAVVFDQSSTGTYAANMTGSGSLTKQNTGTLILTGSNDYSGGTTVSGGTLQGSTTSVQGNITNNAAVVFDQASDGTYAGIMSGSGSLTKTSAGKLTLTGANDYSGGTTVSAGTLQGTSTSLQGNITNNAAVVFDQASSGTYAGVMSGSGSLTKLSSGTLTLTGANTYSGGTTVSAGALQGSSTSLQGNIVNNAAVVFDQVANGTYSGVISGSGSLTKSNSGALTLLGTNTFTGSTTVSGGSLVLGSSNVLSSSTNLTLGADTTLSLNGTSSQRFNTLSYTSATVDFGTTGTANYFLLSGVGTTTGTLTISNWTSGSDIFGIATNAVSQSFLDNVYFSGINVGMGAVLSSTTTAVPGYGSFYTMTPIPTFTWSGGQTTGNSADLDNWSKSDNWVGGIAPAIAAVKALIFAGTVKTSTDMDGAFQVRSILFRSDAGAFTINSSTGDTLTVGGAGVRNESANTQTLNVSVALSAAQTWSATSGDIVFNGASLLNFAHTLTVTGGFNTTINSVIGSGAGGIVKEGSGTLTLTGANTFTGGVTLNAGVVSIGSDGNLGATSGGLTFAGGTLRTTAAITSARLVTLNTGGGTFDSNGFSSTLSGVISGSGGLVKAGTGTLTLSGSNTFSGGVTLNAGVLAIGSDTNLGNTSGGLTFAGGTLRTTAGITSARTVTLNTGGGTIDTNGFDMTLSGAISGSGGLTKTSTGTLTLSGTNNYSGGTTVGGGTLRGSTASVQGNIVNNASVVFDQSTDGTYAGVMSGTGAVTKEGAGNLTVTGANTYSGATTVASGTLVLQNSSGLGTTASGTTVNTGATLRLENNVTVGAEALTLDGTLRNASGTNSYGGAISGSGALVVDGGTLALSGTSANTYTGTTTINSGTLQLGKTAGVDAVAGNITIGSGTGSATLQLTANNQISDTTVITLSSGGTPVFDLNGRTETVGSLQSSNAAAVIQLGTGGTLLTGGNNSSTTYDGVITGAGSLTKAGAGTFTLTGANDYTGGTTITAGTLQGNTTSLQGNITNNAALVFNQTADGAYNGAISGSGSLTKNGAGTLTLTGTSTYTGATAITAGTLALTGSNGIGSTTALTISSGATFDMSGLTQTVGSLAGAGTVALGGGTLRIGADNTSTTFGGTFTGGGLIEKIGSGTLTFNASMNFSGDLTLTGGTLLLAGVNLTVGGTLRITGDTVLDFGSNAASILTATHVVVENGVILTINNWVDLQDFFYATGSFSSYNTITQVTTQATPGHPGPGLPPQNQIVFNGFTNDHTAWLPWDRQITPTPEPATYGAMLMGGALGLLGYRRWRGSRRALAAKSA